MSELRVIGVPGLPEVNAGDDLVTLIAAGIRRLNLAIQAGDIVVITQKIVSKSEGRLVRLDEVEPSMLARTWAIEADKDPRLIEVVLRETRRIVRMDRGILIVETHQGLVCANAGVDASNVPTGFVALLPQDPDASARRLAGGLCQALGASIGVVISDTFGRPWRDGLVNVAIGIAGFRPVIDYRGREDAYSHPLRFTISAVGDELASAAELVMRKTDRVPVAIVQGAGCELGEGSGRELIRPAEMDLFR